jgi:hypothetical protein
MAVVFVRGAIENAACARHGSQTAFPHARSVRRSSLPSRRACISRGRGATSPRASFARAKPIASSAAHAAKCPRSACPAPWLERVGFPKGRRYLISADRAFETIYLQAEAKKAPSRRGGDCRADRVAT